MLNLKQLMELLPDITDYINKEKKLPQTVQLVFMLGLEDYGIEEELMVPQNFKNSPLTQKQLLLKPLKVDQ